MSTAAKFRFTPEGREALVERIKAHAITNYEFGWDVVIETLSEDEIVCLAGWTTSFEGARRKLGKYVSGSVGKAGSDATPYRTYDLERDRKASLGARSYSQVR